jgi:hypothetical protein
VSVSVYVCLSELCVLRVGVGVGVGMGGCVCVETILKACGNE